MANIEQFDRNVKVLEYYESRDFNPTQPPAVKIKKLEQEKRPEIIIHHQPSTKTGDFGDDAHQSMKVSDSLREAY